jgi:hypothetical protein
MPDPRLVRRACHVARGCKSPVAEMTLTTSQRQLRRREAGWEGSRRRNPRPEGHESHCEALRSGRASQRWQSPSSSRDHGVNAAGAWRRWRGLSREVSTGVLDALPFDRRVVMDGGARKSVARRGEISRGRSTGGIVDRREGPNAKPRCRTLVLVGWTLKAANPARGLDGRAGG